MFFFQQTPMSYGAFKSSLSTRGTSWSQRHNVEVRKKNVPDIIPGPGSYYQPLSLMQPSHNTLANPVPPQSSASKRTPYSNRKNRHLRSSFPITEHSISDSITELASNVSLEEGSTISAHHTSNAKMELDAYLASLKINQRYRSDAKERKSLKSALSLMVKLTNISNLEETTATTPTKVSSVRDPSSSEKPSPLLSIGGISWANFNAMLSPGSETMPTNSDSTLLQNEGEVATVLATADSSRIGSALLTDETVVLNGSDKNTTSNGIMSADNANELNPVTINQNDHSENLSEEGILSLQTHLDYYQNIHLDANFFPTPLSINPARLGNEPKLSNISGIEYLGALGECQSLAENIAEEVIRVVLDKFSPYTIIPPISIILPSESESEPLGGGESSFVVASLDNEKEAVELFDNSASGVK